MIHGSIDKMALLTVLKNKLWAAEETFNRTKSPEWLGRVQQLKELIQLIEESL